MKKAVLVLASLFIMAQWVSASITPAAPYGAGVLTITNQTTPRAYVMGADALPLDAGLQFYFDSTLKTSWVRYATDSNQKTAWQGGAIYCVIDKLPINSPYDLLEVTPSNVAMVVSFNATKRSLIITANSAVSYDDIQSTLRTLRFSSKGQNYSTRVIRIWVEQIKTDGALGSYSYKYVPTDNPNINGRMYAVVNKTRPDAGNVDSMNWQQASADAKIQDPRFGITPYFATIISKEEENAIEFIENGNNFIGGSLVSISGTSYWVWGSGPEVNKRFWQGATGGTLFTGDGLTYAGWRGGEPNGGSTGIIAKEGLGNTWNDNTNTATYGGYLIKYGGMPTDANYITVYMLNSNSLIYGSEL